MRWKTCFPARALSPPPTWTPDADTAQPDAERAAALKARRERFTHDILRDLKSLTEGAAAAPEPAGGAAG